MLRAATDVLASAGVPSPEHDARELAAYVLGVRPADLATVDTCSPAQAETFDALVARRAERVPLQHLTGEAHFRRLTLAVGPGVFIPRPETEVVVEAALARGTSTRRRGQTAAPSSSTCAPDRVPWPRRWPSRPPRRACTPWSWHRRPSAGRSATSPPLTSTCAWVTPPPPFPSSTTRSTSSWRTRRTSRRTD